MACVGRRWPEYETGERDIDSTKGVLPETTCTVEMDVQESTIMLEGPAPFLDVVYETIDAHVQRTGEAYEQVITGVGAVDAGDVDHEEDAVLRLYVRGGGGA